MTKQDAMRAIDEAETVAELRAVLLTIVDKLPWSIDVSAEGYRAVDRAGAKAR